MPSATSDRLLARLIADIGLIHVFFQVLALLRGTGIRLGCKVNPWQPRDQITVSFGTGEVTGVFVRDQVCLGPVESAGGGATQAPPPGAVGSPGGGPGVNGTWEALQAPPAGHGCVELRLISATHMTQDSRPNGINSCLCTDP
eukprot:9596426-Alexandrium_andersonii.AAC.1